MSVCKKKDPAICSTKRNLFELSQKYLKLIKEVDNFLETGNKSGLQSFKNKNKDDFK